MSEPMEYKEWCETCEETDNELPDFTDATCLECFWETTRRDKVKVFKPTYHTELNEDAG